MELLTQKKFLKKKNYLQYSLSNFLLWREKQFENLKVDESNINFKNLPIFKKEEFFPHKKTFIYYWLFPFLGFISLTYLSSNQVENFSSIKLFPFLRKENIKTNLAFSTKKEKEINFIELKDKKLKSYTEKLYKIENDEIYNLWNFYFSKTQEFIFPSFTSNSSLNPLSISNFSTQALKECNAENLIFQKNLESSFDFDKSINFIQNNNKKYNFQQSFFENFLNNNILRRSAYYWRCYNLPDKSFFYSISSLKKEEKFFKNESFQNAFKIQKIFPNLNLEECYSSSENLLPEKLNFKKNLIEDFSYNIFEKFLCNPNYQKQIIYHPILENSLKNNILGLKFKNLNISPFSRIEQNYAFPRSYEQVKVDTFPLLSYEKAKFLLDDLIKNCSTSLLIEKKEKILNMKVNLLFDLKTLEKLKLLEQQILLINRNNSQNNINSYLKFHSIFNNEIKFNLIFINKLNLLLNLNNFVSSKFIKKTIINRNNIKLKKQKIQFYKKSLKNYKKTIFKIQNFKFFDQLIKKINFLQYQTSATFSDVNKLFFQTQNKKNINCFSNDINSLKFATYELFLFSKLRKINQNEIILHKKFQNRIKHKAKFLLTDNVNYKFSKIKYFSDIFKNINFNNLSNKNSELKFNLIAEFNQPLMVANFSQKISFFTKNSSQNLDFDLTTSSFLFDKINISLSPYEQNQRVKVPLIFEKKENISSFTVENSTHTILFKKYFDKILQSMFKYLNEKLNVKNLNSENLTYYFQQYENFMNFKLGFLLKKEQIKLFNQHKLNSSSFFYSINTSLLKAKSFKHSKSYRIKKIKKLVQKISISQKFHNRKEEKIFRTYLSSKAKIEKKWKDNFCAKRFNDFFIFNTIKNLKKNSKKALLINNKKSKNFYFLKNKKETKSHYNCYKQTFKNTDLINSQELLFSNLKIKNFVKNESFRLNLFNVPPENLISKVNLSNLNHFRITPNALLRKIGFVFLKEPVFAKNVIDKLDSSNALDKKQDETISRLERQKYIQKKRRRKKLKLENRRRKKRKRFFPRPKWLRFNLYARFLKIRHFKSTKQFLNQKKQISKNFNNTNQKQVCTQVMFIKQTNNNLLKRKFLSKLISPTFLNYKILKDNYKLNQKSCQLNFNNEQLKSKIYRQNKQNFNFYGPIQNFDGNKKIKSKFQKIPLVLELPTFNNNNLFKISNPVMSEFQRLCWKSYWLRSNLTPYIERIQQSFKLIQRAERTWDSKENFHKFLYDLLGLKNDFSETQKSFDNINSNSNKSTFSLSKRKNLSLLWYLNIKDSLKTTNSLSNFTIFQQTQNISEYNRILSQRISDIIKDVKSNLNGKGQSNAKSSKRGRLREMQKNKFESNFVNNLNKRILPNINIFSSYSSMKLFGEIPMLRIGWALNKTNMLSLNEDIQNKWAYVKRRDQNKSNKTKKLIQQFLKKNFLKIPNQKLDLKIYSSFNLSSAFLNNKERNQTLKLENQWIYSDILKNVCFKKIILTDQKIQFLGINQENYSSYLQNLKIKFRKIKNSTDLVQLSKNQDFYSQKNQLMLQTKNNQNPMTNFIDSIYFWQFSIRSNFINFANKITPDSYSFITSSNINSKQSEAFPFLSPNVIMIESLSVSNLAYFTFFSLLALTSLIHFGSLYYLIRIPEIRSLFKFNTLVFFKIWNIYTIVVYSIYDSLKNNKNQFLFLINQLISKKSSKINHSILTISNNLEFHNFRSILVKSSTKKSSILNQKLQINGEFVQLSIRIPFSYSFSIFSNSFDYNSEESENLKKYKEKKFFSLKNKTQKAIIRKSHVENKTEKNHLLNLKVNESLSLVQIISISKNYEKIFSRVLFDLGVYKLILKNKTVNEISNKKKIPFLKQNEGKATLDFAEGSTSSYLSSKERVELFNQFINDLKIKNVKIQSILYLFILHLTKSSILFISDCIHFFYAILTSFLDLLESIMLIIYKFLEKPAELMVDWIGQIFLVEWSSDLLTYIPESFDNYNWNSVQKLWRGNRIFGFFGFLIERRLGCFFDLLLYSIQKSDSDVLMRQQKGMIFWDVWSEILIRAAEKYNINIPSLTTLKEEQELLMEKLCEDKDWTWCQSFIYQLTPLMNLIYPQRPFKWSSFEKSLLTNNYSNQSFRISNLNQEKKFQISSSKRNPYFNFSSNLNDIDDYTQSKEKIFNKNDIWRAWSVNQYFTSQKVDTDLFVNMHLPKSFNHITTLKYYQPIQPILGSLVCQIYSGLFSKQISKNILVIGAPGSGKSLLIQALAGETELKIIFDNARRYSHVQKGVAVGMKMLRDVFESLSFYTPCLFLIEDIHLIGERRPMLISDDDNSKVMEQSFSLENEEVHEKNQIIYQLSRHSISHYRRPYKGDFSLLIPTNHFCFDLFLGINPSQIRKGGLSTKSPLSVEKIEKQLNYSNENDSQSLENSDLMNFSNLSGENNKVHNLISQLQFISEKLFAPPATSPFTILVMKEQQKLKVRKLVKEMPWGGLSWDQIMLLPKVTYSIRVKVALLADITISSLSVKLDIITDLLVIMDSVRSNRGFAVFATTHLPYMLDPALRRPGRLDETISLPFLPNFLNRWEIFQTNLINFSLTCDFFDYSTLFSNLNESHILNFISQAKLSLFNAKISKNAVFSLTSYLLSMNSSNKFLHLVKKEKNSPEIIQNKYSKFPIYSLQQAIKLKINSKVIEPNKIMKRRKVALAKVKNLLNSSFIQKGKYKTESSLLKLLKSFEVYPSIPNTSSNILALAYFQLSKFLMNSEFSKISNNFYKNKSSSDLFHNSKVNKILNFNIGEATDQSNLILFSKLSNQLNHEESIFLDMYSSPHELKKHLMFLFSGKVGEFFIFNNSINYSSYKANFSISSNQKSNKIYNCWWDSLQQSFHSGLWTLSGIDDFWQSATSLVFSLIQKRFLYQQNLLISRMLYFDNDCILREPPSPPASSILMPVKKYENYQRTFKDFQQKVVYSINEKIQVHQQQRLVKKLYNIPIKEYFNSEIIPNRFTMFVSSFKELAYLNSFLEKPTSFSSYYSRRIWVRQKSSFINQWWNGQLAEHNSETTYLSDVDWRSIFIDSLGDLFIDFPDSDQYYNPRQRRWFLNSSYSSYWTTFEKTIPYEIYSHFMIQAFNETYNFLDSQREILDYFTYFYLKKGLLKEIDLISIKARFYSKQKLRITN